MIEVIVLQYLSGVLEVPAFMELPENPPERFLVMEKLGSSMRDHIFTALIVIQSYGGSLYEAATLNEGAKRALLYGPTPSEICRVSLNSDYNFTDPKTKRYRYQAVYDITHY